jgi:hypothetical protein
VQHPLPLPERQRMSVVLRPELLFLQLVELLLLSLLELSELLQRQAV